MAEIALCLALLLAGPVPEPPPSGGPAPKDGAKGTAVSEPLAWGKPLSHWAKALRDEKNPGHTRAPVALRMIGAPAIPTLMDALQDKRPNVRLGAVMGLSRMRPPAKAAVPVLMGALKDSSPVVRRLAAHTLAEIGPPAAAAVPVLVEWLNGTEAGSRAAAIVILGEFGAVARPAVPSLRKALSDPDKGIQRLAAETLTKIEGS